MRFTRFFNNTPMAIASVDGNGRILRTNAPFMKLFADIISRDEIERQIRPTHADQPMEAMLTEASRMLSGLSRGAGLVISSKNDPILKHVEFIRLEPTKALAVLVGEHNQIENRIIDLPAGVTASQLTEAANFLNANLAGQTMRELRSQIENLKTQVATELDTLSQQGDVSDRINYLEHQFAELLARPWVLSAFVAAFGVSAKCI